MSREQLTRLLRGRPCADLARIAAEFPSRVAVVGGAIRDAVLELPARDLDLVVEDDLEGFIGRLEEQLGRRPASIGDRFQDTRRFRWAGVQVDVARTLGSLEEDLARRDFTINALALPLQGDPLDAEGLVDPHGGLVDLEAGLLRQTGPGVLEADPLRALRAVRYAASLPGFRLEEETRAEVVRVAPRLARVAAERKVSEWAEILQLARWTEALAMARETGVAKAALGPLETLAAVEAWASGEGEGPADARARLAALVCDLAEARSVERVIGDLRSRRWPRSLLRHADRVARWQQVTNAEALEVARRALRDPAAAADAAELARRLRGGHEQTERLALFARRAVEERWIRGADLLAAGLRAGPALGDLLEELAVGQVTRRWEGRDEALDWALERAREVAREG